MTIAVLGAGAFGTALALALSRKGPVRLWGRDTATMDQMRDSRKTSTRLPGFDLPDSVEVTARLDDVLNSDCLLLAIPMQQLRGLCDALASSDAHLVACCKGLDLVTWQGPSGVLQKVTHHPAVLTGPSFAADIAGGAPTALTLACADADMGMLLQNRLSTASLRLYRTTDVIGAELGGALKNVIAIGCGVVMGAGLGLSARAALMARGFAEMQRVAAHFGASTDTLQGLSGLGDLALTCTSDQSRNYRFGQALGAGKAFDATVTVEGRATAQSLVALAEDRDLDLPICRAIADLADGRNDVQATLRTLMQRPLKEE
jgi:glycerol-3-phosphate dehydrogenase (NAD(P)+)